MPGRLLHSSLENNNGLPLVPNTRAAGLDACRTAAAARRQHDDDTAASPFSPDSAEEIYAQLRREPDPASPTGLALAKVKTLLLRFGAPEFEAEQARLLAGEEGDRARQERFALQQDQVGKCLFSKHRPWLEQVARATEAKAPPRCMQVGIRTSAVLRGGSCSSSVEAATSCTGNAAGTLRRPWLAWRIYWPPLTSLPAAACFPSYSIVGTTLDADGALWLVLSNRMMVRSDVCSGEPVGIDEVEQWRLHNKV